MKWLSAAATTPLSQTFSAGVARWDSNQLPDELLRAADAALYVATRAGRNRTALADDTNVSLSL